MIRLSVYGCNLFADEKATALPARFILLFTDGASSARTLSHYPLITVYDGVSLRRRLAFSFAIKGDGEGIWKII